MCVCVFYEKRADRWRVFNFHLILGVCGVMTILIGLSISVDWLTLKWLMVGLGGVVFKQVIRSARCSRAPPKHFSGPTASSVSPRASSSASVRATAKFAASTTRSCSCTADPPATCACPPAPGRWRRVLRVVLWRERTQRISQ